MRVLICPRVTIESAIINSKWALKFLHIYTILIVKSYVYYTHCIDILYVNYIPNILLRLIQSRTVCYYSDN